MRKIVVDGDHHRRCGDGGFHLKRGLCPGKRSGGGEPGGGKADILILKTSDYRDLAYRFGGNLVARVFRRGESIRPQEID